MKNRLSRRLLLKGVGGVTLSFPALESLLPKKAWGQATRKRFAMFVRAGNGIVQNSGGDPERFWPEMTGPLTTASMTTGVNATRATSELAEYASRLILIKNVRLQFPRPACGHSEALPQMLTAQNHTGGTSNSPLARGMSIDWRIAQANNPAGSAPLTFMAGPRQTYIAEGLSWSGPQMRTPAERSPLNAFMRLTGLASSPPEVQRLVVERRKSVNDFVREQLREVSGKAQLSVDDKRRLAMHLDAVRDTELRMTCDLDMAQAAQVRAITSPEGNDVRPEVVRRFMDVTAWAFSCGLNSAATLQVGEGNDQTQYTINGTRYPRFHWISHRINSDGSAGEPIPNAVELHHQVDRFQLQLFKYFLDRLASYPSAYGANLLDDCAAVWMNDLGSGPPHSADNTPWIVAGGAGGSLRTGLFIDHQRRTNNQVLNTLASAVGVRKADGSLLNDFGDPSLTGGVLTSLLTVS
ncbi:MAG: DUF1552 domain-containing protein [Myxococcales bacterium]|nr:DUF1552 domain-containing protein [Myxococcales bacterium]